MSKEEEKSIVETIDENGNLIKFELFDIVQFEDKEYALLLPGDEKDKEENDNEIVLMRLIQEADGYSFETIDDDDEFDRVSEYIESFDEED